MFAYFGLIFMVSQAYSQHFFDDRINFTNIHHNPSSYLDRFTSSRQYPLTISEQFIEQYKPSHHGYYYPSPPSQKPQHQHEPQHQHQHQHHFETFTHDNKLHIYVFQNKLSLYCATDSTYERITWRKYACPQHIGNQAGEVVAVGPMVSNPHLYGVNSFGRNEEFVTELLLKQPLTPHSDGAYVCEGTFITDTYPHDGIVTVRDVVVIGGKTMFQNCFPQTTKVNIQTSITNP